MLREHIADKSVDIIYVDPHFKSYASYNMLFKDKSGERSTSHIAVSLRHHRKSRRHSASSLCPSHDRTRT